MYLCVPIPTYGTYLALTSLHKPQKMMSGKLDKLEWKLSCAAVARFNFRDPEKQTEFSILEEKKTQYKAI